jgi:hypothetical protein
MREVLGRDLRMQLINNRKWYDMVLGSGVRGLLTQERAGYARLAMVEQGRVELACHGRPEVGAAPAVCQMAEEGAWRAMGGKVGFHPMVRAAGMGKSQTIDQPSG